MIWALHGAFGDASDWDGLAAELDCDIRSIDLWSPEHDLSLAEWGRVFNRTVSDADSEPVLLGYSMGARLGLHALIQEDSPWKAAILASPQPGIPPDERHARRESDDRWLQRFDQLEWSAFWEAWNAQPVFESAAARRRHEKRDGMRRGLDLWSIAEQRDLLPELHRITCPVAWVTGGRDAKYSRIAKATVPQLLNAQHLVVDGAGHRVPWDAAEEFRNLVRNVVESL